MKKNFAELPRPLITASLRHRTTEAIIEDIKRSEADGARSFILHIPLMNEEYHNFTEFTKIASSTEFPIMAIN